jgi:hypothetical protein
MLRDFQLSCYPNYQAMSHRNHFVGFAYQGKDIVFTFILEYSSLMDFGP